MYASQVDGNKLTFGVSGKLWNRSLIMYDEQTNSDWSHILGKAMAGPLKDQQLTQLPSVMTDWKSWSEAHPQSSVLWMSATSDAYRRGFYRHQPERFVLGITDEEDSMAWGFDVLSRQPVVHGEFKGQQVVAVFDRGSVTARLYSRHVDEQTLAFALDDQGQLCDAETGTIWDPITGRAIAGNLQGRSLTALPAILSYRKTWRMFHPDSTFSPGG